MSEKPISPLRQRMIEDMSVRNFVEKTRNHYIRHVRIFTALLLDLLRDWYRIARESHRWGREQEVGTTLGAQIGLSH